MLPTRTRTDLYAARHPFSLRVMRFMVCLIAVLASGGAATAAAQSPPSAGLATSDDPADPSLFDLSGLPAQPTNFDEQRLQEMLQDPNTRSNAVLTALTHRMLGRYYAAHGRVDLAGVEYGRAVLSDPADHRGFQGLAALQDAAGNDPSTAASLRDVAAQLQSTGLSDANTDEPEPAVAQPDPGKWQEVSRSFNQRMNTLYTSNAWSNVYRTVFTNLYGSH